MPEPTASLIFPDMPGGDLVFSGVDNANPFGLIDMNEPGRIARITYATDSPDVEGSVALQAVWQIAMLNAVVGVRADDQATLEERKAAVLAAVGRFSYTVVTVVNGYQQAWRADMGSMTPASDSIDLNDLRDFEAYYALSIPVDPTPGA